MVGPQRTCWVTSSFWNLSFLPGKIGLVTHDSQYHSAGLTGLSSQKVISQSARNIIGFQTKAPFPTSQAREAIQANQRWAENPQWATRVSYVEGPSCSDPSHSSAGKFGAQPLLQPLCCVVLKRLSYCSRSRLNHPPPPNHPPSPQRKKHSPQTQAFQFSWWNEWKNLLGNKVISF